jgi:hypothetical protein
MTVPAPNICGNIHAQMHACMLAHTKHKKKDFGIRARAKKA